jgi:Protein of unknown function (DUF2877)
VIAGLGAVEALDSAVEATVIATSAKAAYLRFPGGVVALTAPGICPGPLHLSSPIDPSSLRVGATFVVPYEWRETLTVWRGRTPDLEAFDVRRLVPIARHSALLAPPYLDRWRAACELEDLSAAAGLLGGLGPGLTPSGDDALAGMLLARRLRWPHGEDDLVALARQIPTHEISRAFLGWAARGQSIEPVHRLLAGDATGGPDLAACGHTSGADLALGLAVGLAAPSLTGLSLTGLSLTGL